MAEALDVGCSMDKGKEDRLEDSVELLSLNDDPSTSALKGQVYHQTPIVVKPAEQSTEYLYKVFSKQFKIAECKPSEVLARVQHHLEDHLMDRKWLALWRGGLYSAFGKSLEVLVEVEDVCGDQARISLLDPTVYSMSEVPLQVIQTHLEEMECLVDVTELFPVVFSDTGGENEESLLKEATEIATLLENTRFFFEHIRRDWDDEDDREQEFDSCLRSRLQLHSDIVNGCAPSNVVARYSRTMSKYITRRKELLEYQMVIQKQGEPTTSEAVECWRKYYEVLMLSGLLQIWETLQLKVDGPCFPRVSRKKKGRREDGSTITHLVSRTLTPLMLKSIPDEMVFMQHESPHSALKCCHEGDEIILFPGVYSGEGFHELTESITIKGMGNKDDIVVKAICHDDLFINISSATVKMENITFVQSAGVEIMPGSTVVLEDNLIIQNQEVDDTESFNAEDLKTDNATGKGAVHIHVVDPPSITMKGNRIECQRGNSLSIGRKEYSTAELVGYKRRNVILSTDATEISAKGEGERNKIAQGMLKLIFGEDGLRGNVVEHE